MHTVSVFLKSSSAVDFYSIRSFSVCVQDPVTGLQSERNVVRLLRRGSSCSFWYRDGGRRTHFGSRIRTAAAVGHQNRQTAGTGDTNDISTEIQ